MCSYIVKRLLYSILIILGVILLTFFLFRVAAGDPTSILLGKNPSPQEVESLKNKLQINLPLVYGSWIKTEMFNNKNISKKLNSFSYKQMFKNSEYNVKTVFTFKGELNISGKLYYSDNKREASFIIKNPQNDIVFTTNNPETSIYSIKFYRQNSFFLNSQLLATLKEIISFKSEYPFISVLNFGKSFMTGEPVTKILINGAGPSLLLMIPIFLGEIFIGIIFALISTIWKDSIIDKFLTLFSIIGMSVSYLVFIILGQWYFAYYFNWFPVWGYGEVRHFYLPVIIGIVTGLGGGVRFYKTIFVNELDQDYLRTALAKGCSSFAIYAKHLLRNAILPIITRSATSIPFLFTGSLLLEKFFGIPGLGYIGIAALENADLQIIKALVIITAFLFIIINLLVDISYAVVDPRITIYSKEK